MINVCLFGTCCLWPVVLVLSSTHIENIEFIHNRWLLTLITMISAVGKTKEFLQSITTISFFFSAYSVLTIVISFKYSVFANVACFLIVIPSISRKFFSLTHAIPSSKSFFSHRSLSHSQQTFLVSDLRHRLFICWCLSFDHSKRMVSSQ